MARSEGDGEAHLARGEVAAVEGVAFFGGGEPGVLTDGPGPGDVHAGIGAAKIGGNSGDIVEVVESGEVLFCIEGFDVDVLHGFGDEFIEGFAGELFGLFLPRLETARGEADGVVG